MRHRHSGADAAGLSARKGTMNAASLRLLSVLILAVSAVGCVPTSKSPLLSKIEDIQDAAALVATESRYSADRDALPLKEACGIARGAILEGRLRLAVECAMRTLYLGQREKNPSLTAEGARILAEAYGFAGKLDLSSRFAKLALREAATLLLGSQARASTEAVAWRVLGENLSRQQRYAEALEVFQLAERLPPVSTFSRETLSLAIANTHLRAGKVDIARELFTRIASHGEVPPKVRAQALRGLGDVFTAQDRLSEALAQYQEALRVARRANNLPELVWVLERVGRTSLRGGNRTAAVRHLQTAVDIVEGLRAEFRSEEFRTAFFGSHSVLYDELLGVLVADGRVADAFAVSERSRARALRDMMAHRTTVLDLSGARAVRETEDLRQQVALARVDQHDASAEGMSAAARIAELESRLRDIALRTTSREASVDLVVRPASATSSAADVQARLPGDAALLEYHVLENETLLWRLDRSSLRLHLLAIGRSALRGLVDDFRRAVIGRDSSAPERARALYRLLVGPALTESPAGSVIIVPHDVLHFLPFAALADDDGRFLVERTPLSVLPSASTLDLDRPSLTRTGVRLAAFGNPVTDPQYRLAALPGAEAEARAIGEVFAGAKVFTGRLASKTTFLAEAPRQHIVHVAAHALFDDVDPMASAVFLAPDKKNRGRLEAQEIFAQKLGETRLVVLSACQTGLGRLGRGDEVIGLSRALLAAGVRSLVLSLWEVDDESTARLMAAFYRQLQDTSLSESLRRAQLEVMQTHREPFFWASFFVVDLLQR